MTRMWLDLQRNPAGRFQRCVMIVNFSGQMLHSIIAGVCGFVMVPVLYVLYSVRMFPRSGWIRCQRVIICSWLKLSRALCSLACPTAARWGFWWSSPGGRGWWRPEVLLAAPEIPTIQKPSGYSRSDRGDGSLMNIMSKKMPFKHTVQILECFHNFLLLLYCLKL